MCVFNFEEPLYEGIRGGLATTLGIFPLVGIAGATLHQRDRKWTLVLNWTTRCKVAPAMPTRGNIPRTTFGQHFRENNPMFLHMACRTCRVLIGHSRNPFDGVSPEIEGKIRP